MQTTIEKHAEITIAHMEGRLDAHTSSAVEKELVDLIAGGAHRLVIDCDKMEYISSAGLRVLLTVTKKIKAAGGGIALAALKPSLKEIFEIAGFTSLFGIHATVADAEQSL